ncbi:alpha/beta hydrolase family protein [Micromonospora sp. RP3T]|uniref:alpha/beta hydrolase family protein n=1 Tax=Micromonospora sp. RP3T TaxID=2135446 RepID=UPI003D7526A7
MPWTGATHGAGEAAAGVYARSSVTTYAADCRTPILFIQNEGDQRTPASQSDQLYAALHIHGCVTEMLRVPGAPHAVSVGFGHPRARTAQNEALRDWVCRHLPRHEATDGVTIRNSASNA